MTFLAFDRIAEDVCDQMFLMCADSAGGRIGTALDGPRRSGGDEAVRRSTEHSMTRVARFGGLRRVVRIDVTTRLHACQIGVAGAGVAGSMARLALAQRIALIVQKDRMTGRQLKPRRMWVILMTLVARNTARSSCVLFGMTRGAVVKVVLLLLERGAMKSGRGGITPAVIVNLQRSRNRKREIRCEVAARAQKSRDKQERERKNEGNSLICSHRFLLTYDNNHRTSVL